MYKDANNTANLHIISSGTNNKEHYFIIFNVQGCIHIRNWLSSLPEFLFTNGYDSNNIQTNTLMLW